MRRLMNDNEWMVKELYFLLVVCAVYGGHCNDNEYYHCLTERLIGMLMEIDNLCMFLFFCSYFSETTVKATCVRTSPARCQPHSCLFAGTFWIIGSWDKKQATAEPRHGKEACPTEEGWKVGDEDGISMRKLEEWSFAHVRYKVWLWGFAISCCRFGTGIVQPSCIAYVLCVCPYPTNNQTMRWFDVICSFLVRDVRAPCWFSVSTDRETANICWTMTKPFSVHKYCTSLTTPANLIVGAGVSFLLPGWRTKSCISRCRGTRYLTNGNWLRLRGFNPSQRKIELRGAMSNYRSIHYFSDSSYPFLQDMLVQ